MSAAALYRWSVAFRTLAAILGGYVLTNLLTIALILSLMRVGAPRGPTALSIWMASLVIWAAIIMGVFHARTAWRAWLGLGLAAIPCGLIIALSKLTGGF